MIGQNNGASNLIGQNKVARNLIGQNNGASNLIAQNNGASNLIGQSKLIDIINKHTKTSAEIIVLGRHETFKCI